MTRRESIGITKNVVTTNAKLSDIMINISLSINLLFFKSLIRFNIIL